MSALFQIIGLLQLSPNVIFYAQQLARVFWQGISVTYWGSGNAPESGILPTLLVVPRFV